jgi:hypothetical protein
MKIQVTLKDPDGFSNSIDEAVQKSLSDLGLEEDEMEPLIERRREKVEAKLERWVRYNEYVTVEFDLDAGTATVVENKSR